MHVLKRSLLLLGVTALTLTACKDDDPVAADTIAVTSITASPPSVEVTVGGTVQVSASVGTNGGTGTIDLTVAWSGGGTIASVSSAGVVTGLVAGNTTVTATSNANTAFKASVAVKVNPAAQAPNALLSLVVNPTSAAFVLGGTQPVSTIHTASPGATVTYANSALPATRCAVTATGANPTISTVAGATAGPCVISILASGTGTGLAPNSIAGSVAVTITAQPPALLSLTLNPTTALLAPGGTQVITTTAVLGPGATVSYANSSSNTAVATVTPTGANPTITATGNGDAQITITASGTGGGNQANQITATVNVNVAAASVSISSVTTCIGVPVCAVTPVNLAGVLGQIEATLNINSGNQQIGSVSVELGIPGAGSSCLVGAVYTEAHRQIFGVNGAPTAPVTLSINTAEFDANFVPKWINGQNCLRARIFPVVGAPPDASNTYLFTLVNPDVVYFNNSVGIVGGAFGLNHTGTSAPQVGVPANIWWRSGFTFRAHPVLYSGPGNVVSITYASNVCNGAGVAALPPAFSATFSCAGVQSAAQAIGAGVAIAYVPTYTLTVSPVAFMTAATPGYVPGRPVYSVVSTREDNVGPVTATPTFNAPGTGGWHGNGSNALNLPPTLAGTTYSVTVADGGVGVTATPVISEITTGAAVTAANQLAETLTPTPYQLRGLAVADVLGNPGTQSGLTSVFGVDLAVLNANYANRATSAFPAIFGGVNGTIYSDVGAAFGPAWAPIDGVTDMIAIDAIDSRSGLDNPTALKQNIVRRAPGVATTCVGSPAPNTAFSMLTVLADNFVQSAGVQIDCGLLIGARVGEYRWQGYVSDRAGNARKALRSGITLDSVFIGIDGALPNITGIGFQTALYTHGLPASWTFSANDDYELKDGSVSLVYTGLVAPVTYPFGSSIFTPTSFSTPFDGTFVNVLNNQSLSIANYIVAWDVTTAAGPFVGGAVPAGGNVAGFTSTGINTAVTANVRDAANQPAAAPLVAPVLATQILARTSVPAYSPSMIDWRIMAKSGANVLTIQDVSASSVGVAFCERVDIYEVIEAGGDVLVAGMLVTDALIGDDVGDELRYRSTVTSLPVPGAIPDNGFQRFLVYTSAAHTNSVPSSGRYTAACVKNLLSPLAGGALFSPIF